MLHTFALKMETMKIKKKQEESERALAIFFPRCTKRRPKNECPLNVLEIYSVCEENHVIEKFPSISRSEGSVPRYIRWLEANFCFQLKKTTRLSTISTRHARVHSPSFNQN